MNSGNLPLHHLAFFRTLAGRTLFITGATRGIGKAIGLRAAKDGANVVIAAKSSKPHPKLPGTIYTAAEESKLFMYLLVLVFLEIRVLVEYSVLKLF